MEYSRNINKGYFAFISYKREDAKWADWLQNKLENYKLPSNLGGKDNLPKAIRPVFKDTTELNPTYLPQQIKEALADSKYLIVVCSPLSAQSEWVNKEVETFIDMGKTDFIIPFIIEGEPHSEDPKSECYPKALRDLPPNKEILGANIKEFSKDAALVKVIAQMLGLKFDVLWQRAEKYKRKQYRIRLALTCFLLMLSVCIGVFLFSQNWKIKENHARYMIKEMESLIDQGESYTAARLALALLPKNIKFPNRPYLPEVEAVLREALNREKTTLLPDELTAVGGEAIFSPDGSLIAVEDLNKTHILRTKDGMLLYTLWVITDVDTEVHVKIDGFSSDGNYLVTNLDPLEDPFSTSVWNMQTGEKEQDIVDVVDIAEINRVEDGLKSYVFNPERTKLLRTSRKGIEIQSIVAGSFISDFQINTEFIDQIRFTPSGQYIIGKHGNQFMVWNSQNGKMVKQFSNTWDIYMGEPRPLYITTQNKKIAVFNASDGHVLFTLANNIPLSDISAIYFSNSGKRIVVETTNGGSVFFYDTDTGKEVLSLSVLTEGDFHGNISNDDKIYVADGVLSPNVIYNLETGNQITILQTGDFYCFCISNDNKWIAVIGENNRCLYYHELNNEYSAKSLAVIGTNSVAFSPDNKLLLSCHNDSTVRVWDVKTGILMCTLWGHHAPVVSASFSPDGREIISSSTDGEIKRWKYLPSQEFIDKARERFKDVPLTKEERKKFFF